MITKVCGMREAENIKEVEALGVDLMGFIFWPHSSRRVIERPSYLPKRCKRVGVFVDEEPEVVLQTAQEYALDFIQLHGKESPEYLSHLKGYRLIKAFNIAESSDFERCKPYEGLVDFFLFDTKGKSVGGNGEKFDWEVLKSYRGGTPFLLSGGIGPEDGDRLKTISHEQYAGIDLNSRFELSPGLKDITTLKAFFKSL